MKAKLLQEEIYWVGAIDWHLRSFHGYKTERGTTYNSYLIIDDKITLIDNVKEKFTEEMVERIRSVTDPGRIDVIISNHSEPDHSGSLKELMKIAPNAKVFASPNGIKILSSLYGNLPVIPVKNFEEMKIGKRILKFIHVPMVHWPDSMATYDSTDRILFSNDAFGQHYATSKRLDREIDLPIALQEAKKYYANIVLPYSNQANKTANALKEFPIDMIATGHGIIWKDHIADIMALYEEMTTAKKKEKAVVVFDSMWGTTSKLAALITDCFIDCDIDTILFDINNTDMSNIVPEIWDAKYLAVGSSTINNMMLPPIGGFLTYLKGLAPVDIAYLAFGSYGWGGQSIDLIEAELEKMKFSKLIPSIKIRYALQEEDKIRIQTELFQALKK